MKKIEASKKEREKKTQEVQKVLMDSELAAMRASSALAAGASEMDGEQAGWTGGEGARASAHGLGKKEKFARGSLMATQIKKGGRPSVGSALYKNAPSELVQLITMSLLAAALPG